MVVASGGARVNRNPQQVSWMGVNKIIPGNICHDVSVKNSPSSVLVEVVVTSSPCGINGNLQVANKRLSTSPALFGNTQKLDAAVDGKLTSDLDSVSIFSKVIGHNLSDGSI